MRTFIATTLVSGLGVVGFIAGSMGLSFLCVPTGLGMVLFGGLLNLRSE
jgi:hypothetical protein